MITFDAVQPIGARTCCDLGAKTGNYQHVWLTQDVPEYVVEWRALQQGNLHPQLTRRHHLDAIAILNSLMNRAAKGQLRVGYDRSYPVRVMTTVPYILELRPAFPSPRVVRLYYAEPTAKESALLPLVLSTKPASSDTAEQNQSIDEAKVRSRTWTLYNVIGGKK